MLVLILALARLIVRLDKVEWKNFQQLHNLNLCCLAPLNFLVESCGILTIKQIAIKIHSQFGREGTR